MCGPWLAPETWSDSIVRCVDDLKASVTGELRIFSQEFSIGKEILFDVCVGTSFCLALTWRRCCRLLTGWWEEVVRKHDAIRI